MSDPPLRIGLWAAVSSAPQATEDKSSLEHQEARGRAFAEAVGGSVVALYLVPGHSRDLIFYHEAESLIPAYGQLRQDVEAGHLDVLWCLDVDRLGRDPALAQQVISLVEKHGAEVYTESAPHQIGSKTTAHRYISAIQSVRAGEDQRLRVHRHRAGMRGRVEKRGLLPGKPPFWLDVVRDETGQTTGYELNENAGVVREMTRLFLAGHGYHAITRRLNQSHPRPAGAWQALGVRTVLNYDVPAGYTQWGPFKSPGPSPHIPAIWDTDTLAAVERERLRRNGSGYWTSGKRAGALAGVAFCARCGGPMGLNTTPQTTYRRCSRHARVRHDPSLKCHANNIQEAVLLDHVADMIRALSSPEVLDGFLAELANGGQGPELEQALARTRKDAEQLEAQRLRLAHALATGDLDAAMYRQADDQILAQLQITENQLATLQTQIATLPDIAEYRALLEELSENWHVILETMEPAEVAAMLQRAGIRVMVENGVVVG